MKDIRRLRRSKDEGRLLLEGPHLLAEALDAGVELEATLATREFLDAAETSDLFARLVRPPLVVEAGLLDELTDADSPKGLVAIGRRAPTRLADIPVATRGVYVFADGLQDPGNLGALCRVAEAAGATALLLGPGSCRLEHPRALRASAGSLLRLSTVENVDIESLDGHLGSGSVRARWLALAPRRGTDLYSTGFDALIEGALVLAVGGEGPGLGAAVTRRTDELITIPMAGPVESLNATVAAALALFEIARRRRSE